MHEIDPRSHCAYAQQAALQALQNHSDGNSQKSYCHCGVYFYVREPRFWERSATLMIGDEEKCTHNPNLEV